MSISSFQCDLLALTFVIAFVPGILFAIHFVPKYGLKETITYASVLQACGAALVFVFFPKSAGTSSTLSYIGIFFGQLLAGLSQPAFTTITSQLSVSWFHPNQQPMANIVASLSNPLGIAANQVLMSFIFPKTVPDDLTTLTSRFSWVIGVHSITAFLFALCWITMLRASSRSTTSLQTSAASTPSASPITRTFRQLPFILRRRGLIYLLAAFSLGYGAFNTLLMQFTALLQPCNLTHSSLTPGLLSAILIASGMLGCAILGALISGKPKKEIFPLVWKSFLLAAISFCLFILRLHREQNDSNGNDSSMIFIDWIRKVPFVVFCILAGATALPLLPITLESSMAIVTGKEESESGIISSGTVDSEDFEIGSDSSDTKGAINTDISVARDENDVEDTQTRTIRMQMTQCLFLCCGQLAALVLTPLASMALSSDAQSPNGDKLTISTGYSCDNVWQSGLGIGGMVSMAVTMVFAIVFTVKIKS